MNGSMRAASTRSLRRFWALAAVVPLALAACGSEAEEVVEDASDTAESVVDDVEDGAEEMADEGEEMADDAKEGAEEMADDAKEGAEEMADDMDGHDDAGECGVEDLALHTPGVLTIATGDPVFPPWMIDDDPTNGQGFESAVAYALAEKLGFGADQVVWVRTTFDAAISPGEKDYDFNMQQYSITEDREQIVDFSMPYYVSEKALVALDGSAAASATSLADLQDLKFGATIGTTDLAYIEDVIGVEAAVYNEQVDVVSALGAGQIDATVVGLPTAFFLTAVQIDNGVIAGVLPGATDEGDAMGLLFSEGNELVDCVDAALMSLTEDGTLDAIADEWLQGDGEIPDITP